MTKEVLLALLKKDLKELAILLDGLSENTQLPPSITALAVEKAENILNILKEFSAEKMKKNAEKEPEEKPRKPKRYEIALDDEDFEPREITDEDEEETRKPKMYKVAFDDENYEPREITAETKPEIQPEIEEISPAEKTEEKPVETLQTLNESVIREEELATKFNHQKIADLKDAISIGERFLFQRELFDGDGEKMINAFQKLNAMTSLAEAKKYLAQNFAWSDENACKAQFFEILKRKF